LLDEGGYGRIRWRTFPSLCLNAPGGRELMWWDCDSSGEDHILFHVPAQGQGQIVLASRPNDCVSLPPGEGSNGVWFQMESCDVAGPERTHFQVEVEDCIWGEWSEWSTCSAPCGGGRLTRTTMAANRAAAKADHGRCRGQLRQSMPCNRQSCGSPSLSETMLQPAAAFLRLESDPRWCLSIRDSVTLQACADDARLLYMLPADGVGVIRWRAHPQQCLDAPGGRQVQMWDCNTSPAEHINFTMTSQGDLASPICLAADPSLCLVTPHVAAGHEVELATCGAGSDACARFKAHFVDCAWNPWAEWSPCTERCGGGTRQRSRVHSTTKTILSCQAAVVEDESEPCNEQQCE